MFRQTAIIGVGLLGASLGLGLKARGLSGTILGVGRRESSLRAARDRGAVDHTTLDVAEAVGQADLVVIATPAGLVESTLDNLRPHLLPDAVVTDVASTKAAICAHASSTWPAPRRFVGSHPMAGSEQFGPEHGRADLYEGSVCLVECGDGIDAEARAAVVALWEALGARVVDIQPEAHDALLARTSHVPHILSTAIATCAGKQGDIKALIGNGYRDMTRIAAGRPEIWRDISLTNRKAILEALTEMQACLAAAYQALDQEDAAALDAFFETGRQARLDAVPE